MSATEGKPNGNVGFTLRADAARPPLAALSCLLAAACLTGCGQPLPAPAIAIGTVTVPKLADYRSDAQPEDLLRELEARRARPPIGVTQSETRTLRDEHWTLLVGLADRILESDASEMTREAAGNIRLEAMAQQALALAPVLNVPGAATDPRIEAFLEAAKQAVQNRQKLPETAAAASALRVRTAGLFLREAVGPDQEIWLVRLADFCIQQALAHYPGADRAAERDLASAANLAESLGVHRVAINCYEAWNQGWPNEMAGKLAAFSARRVRGIGQPFVLEGPLYPSGRFDLKSLAGKKVLVHVWTSNTPGQAERMQDMARAARVLRQNGWELVGVCLDPDDKQLKQAQEAGLLTWPQLFTPHSPESPAPHPLAGAFGIAPSPFFLMVDEQGKLADSYVSPSDLNRLMQNVMKPQPSPQP